MYFSYLLPFFFKMDTNSKLFKSEGVLFRCRPMYLSRLFVRLQNKLTHSKCDDKVQDSIYLKVCNLKFFLIFYFYHKTDVNSKSISIDSDVTDYYTDINLRLKTRVSERGRGPSGRHGDDSTDIPLANNIST